MTAVVRIRGDLVQPPYDEAYRQALKRPAGSSFIIERRGQSPIAPLFRWDVTEWKITSLGPQMTRCGFGITRRGARRSLDRCDYLEPIE